MAVFGVVNCDFAALTTFFSLGEVGHINIIFVGRECPG